MTDVRLCHGTAVNFGDNAMLLRGPPGAGKSSLALRLIDSVGYGLGLEPLKATLVADDQVILRRIDGLIMMSPPEALAGKLEIRGLGIVSVAFQPQAKLSLVVDLSPGGEIQRMPELVDLNCAIIGSVISRIQVDPHDPAVLSKLRSALKAIVALAPSQA